MIYLDTSALVKLYVRESFTGEMLQLASSHERLASHQVLYVEFHATVARLGRESRVTEDQSRQIKRDFLTAWPTITQVGLTGSLLERAAELAEGFALRGYDSLHLAAADLLRQTVSEPLVFASFDRHLNRAAKLLGMKFPDFIEI
ncbi:MAG: type II toxin-antitoxin system VapC family toxin [Sulfurisoma sp.]|nr:type II toxin-antitoxin system VapC family toxin [Sulfurisoma sp.]